jgi:hypothetical protein
LSGGGPRKAKHGDEREGKERDKAEKHGKASKRSRHKK